MKRLRCFGFLVFFAACSLLGCGEQGPGLIPVSGTVTLDSKPLSGALVTLVPQGETPGQGSFGHTDAAGKFELQTMDGKPGVVAGDYRVLINKQVNPDGTDFVPTEDISPMDSNAREIVPARYNDHERTTLKATISAESEPLNFELQSKAK